MKKTLLAFLIVALLGVTAFAAPFAKIDITLPDKGVALIGIQSGNFVMQTGISDLLGTPGFAFQAVLTQDFKDGLIETEYGVSVDDLGFAGKWYKLKLEIFELGVSGVIHLGEVFCILNDDPDAEDVPAPLFDIYGGLKLVYEDPVLMPTASLGIYWGDVGYGGNNWSLFDWL